MGEKVYKPIVREGDHLADSSTTPGRKRGISFDENNKNPDIVEWEEYDLDDLHYRNETISNYHDEAQLTPEQEEFAQMVGEALAAALITGGTWLFMSLIKPWWQNSVSPWAKDKWENVKAVFVRKNLPASENSELKTASVEESQLNNTSRQIETIFNESFFNLSQEEIKEHMMKLLFHVLGVVNEIRIISNAQIKRESESEEIYLQRVKESETFLMNKVATCLDNMLSMETLRLDMNTSRQLFSLTGGGIKINGEYVPVQAEKIDELMKSLPIDRNDFQK